MRSVRRGPKPQILIDNERGWTLELINELNRISEDIPLDDKHRQAKINRQCKVSQVKKSISSRYNSPDIKQALQNMYEKRCCYCEGKITPQIIDHIEHLRPKSLFPHLIVDWDNLHCCCPVCNQNKQDQWDFKNPILDPTVDKVEDYLRFDLNTGQVINIKGDLRTQNTIDYPKLNRPELVEERKSIILSYAKKLKYVKQLKDRLPEELRLEIIKRYIKMQTLNDSYPTLHQQILEGLENEEE